MEYRYLHHTADVRMQVKGGSFADIVTVALRGMNDLMLPGYCEGVEECTIQRSLTISAADQTALLIDFLSEVLTRSHTERALFCRVEIMRSDERTMEASIYGVRINGFEEDIKAVTYHEAEVVREADGTWQTLIVFDI